MSFVFGMPPTGSTSAPKAPCAVLPRPHLLSRGRVLGELVNREGSDAEIGLQKTSVCLMLQGSSHAKAGNSTEASKSPVWYVL